MDPREYYCADDWTRFDSALGAAMTRGNLLLIGVFTLGFLGGHSLGFASGTSSNLWLLSKHVEEGGAVTITATIEDINHPPAEFNPNAPGGMDDHGYGLDLTAPAQLILDTGSSGRIGTKFTAGYYRGPIYLARGDRAPFVWAEANSTNNVSIFSNGNRSELIAAVDNGPVFTSTNFGITWKAVTVTGVHKFPLCTASDGGGLYARVTVHPPPSPPEVAAGTNAPVPEWYAVASSADGSKLVVSASLSQPAPALNIRYSSNAVTIVWPAQFSSFVLEHKAELNSATWTTITNSVRVVGEENRVVIPSAIGAHFFRLRVR
jgi:hypothetical protein